MSRRQLFLGRIAGALILWAAAGCVDGDSSGWGAQNDPSMESNIIRVNKFFSADPWLSFDGEGAGKVDGVRCTVYLESAKQPKGVFGDGTIVVDMYRLDGAPSGGKMLTHVFKWELSPQEAYPWRAKKETMMGWGYGLRLNWGKGQDVAGRRVAFVVRYIRNDGRLISSSRQVLKVPIRGVDRSGMGMH